MLPLWQKSSGRFGYVCGQVDPRFTRDLDAMKRQALSLIAASPNVMVKCPGSAEGLQLVEQLTAMGIPTNATMSFSVSQYVECMNAVSRGIDKAVSGKIDMSRWRSVITHMSSRIGELGELQSQAKARNINLTPADIRWAEIAIFKKAYFLGLKRNHPSKMLMCSMRIDHDLEPGRPSSWHIEKVAGSAAVFTCPPSYIAGLMEVEHAIPELNPDAINEKIPEAVLDRLKRVPFFEQSYEIDGMTTAEFSRYASFERTEAEFSKAAAKIIGFTAEQFSAPGRSAVSYE
jgi:transaldolase